MAKAKKRGLAAYKTKKRARRNPTVKNEAIDIADSAEDMAIQVGSAFAGYGGSRVVARLLYTALRKKYPRLAPWSGSGAAAMVFLAIWLGGSKVKSLQKYHTALTIGAGIALLQNVIRTWIPKLGLLVGDYQQDSTTPAALPPQQNRQAVAPAQIDAATATADDDGNYGVDDDGDGVLDDIGDILNPGETQSDLYGGVFSG